MKQTIVAAVLLAAQCAWAVGPDIEFKCPRRIRTQQVLYGPADDWRQSTEKPQVAGSPGDVEYSEHNLDFVTFSTGVPEDRAVLRPDLEVKAKHGKWSTSWKFEDSREIWFACHYRATTVMLSRQLPPDVKTCTAEYMKNVGIAVQRVWCQ
jgi:hypothetical protein